MELLSNMKENLFGEGKWQYEVQLGSKGVMQLGWATLETKFSQEKGVGTIKSFDMMMKDVYMNLTSLELQ